MSKRVLFAVPFLLMSVLATTRAHATEIGKDVFGRPVPVGEGRPTLMFYTNQDTRDVLRDHAFKLAYELREHEPVVVVRVDLRDVPGFFKGSAKKEIRKAHNKSMQRIAAMFQKDGLPLPPELKESLYIIADSNGAPHKEVGLSSGFDRAYAKALDAKGRELAKGAFPTDGAKLAAAIEKTSSPGRSLASR